MRTPVSGRESRNPPPPARPLRLLVLLPGLEVGGTEQAICRLLGSLDRLLITPLVATFRPGGACGDLVPADVPWHVLGPHTGWRRVRTIFRLVELVRKERVEIVFSVLNSANVVALSARLLGLLGAPLVIGVRSDYRYGLREGTRFRRVKRWMVRYLYPRADRILCVTDEVRRVMVEDFQVPGALCRTLGNLVPVSPDHPSTPDRDHELEQWMRSSTPIVLGVGRLDRVKQFDRLVEAFPHVRRDREARLLILGDGPERARLTSLIQALGLEDVCRLAGFVSEPMRYMMRATCLVVTSCSEGFPNVVAEALACGLPVVSYARLEAVAGMIRDNLRCQVVSDETSHALAGAIVKAVDGSGTSGMDPAQEGPPARDNRGAARPGDYENEFHAVVRTRQSMCGVNSKSRVTS